MVNKTLIGSFPPNCAGWYCFRITSQTAPADEWPTSKRKSDIPASVGMDQGTSKRTGNRLRSIGKPGVTVSAMWLFFPRNFRRRMNGLGAHREAGKRSGKRVSIDGTGRTRYKRRKREEMRAICRYSRLGVDRHDRASGGKTKFRAEVRLPMISRVFSNFSVRSIKPLLAGGLALLIAACSSAEHNYPTTEGRGPNNPNPSGERESIFGEDGLVLFGGKANENGGEGGGIGVNSFLWRASLDTLSFVPLVSADPFGGVIISEWYNDAATPDERFKLTVYILDRRLRADGLKVAVFRQTRQGAEWQDASANPATATQLENAILIRARELRVNTLEAGQN